MKHFKILALAAMLAVAASATPAIESGDIASMVREKVGDEVIVNMVKSSPLPRPLNAFEVAELSNSGASQPLLLFLTSREAVDPGYVRPAPPLVTESSPSVVVEESVTYVNPEYITESPSVVVTSPPTVVYEDTYYYPGYYYPNYSYRNYYPGYNSMFFGFGWGGGSYWRDRDYYRGGSHRYYGDRGRGGSRHDGDRRGGDRGGSRGGGRGGGGGGGGGRGRR